MTKVRTLVSVYDRELEMGSSVNELHLNTLRAHAYEATEEYNAACYSNRKR